MNSNTASNVRHSTTRRSGFAVLAALGLPLGALLVPGTASAAPGGPLDDLGVDLPLDVPMPDFEIDVVPGAFTPMPFPAPPGPFPIDPPDVPDVPEVPGVPGPDDGPTFPVELPELGPILDRLPFDPGDLELPTDDEEADEEADDDDDADEDDDAPADDGEDDGPDFPIDIPELKVPDFDIGPFEPGDFVLPTDDDDDDDDDDDEPACLEYDGAAFDADVARYDADRIEIRLMYGELDVCDFTVWTAIAEPGAVGTLADTTVGMSSIAFATDSAGYYQQTYDDFDLCDLEIRVAVEESLAWTVPFTDPGCETPEEGEIPGDDTPDDGDGTPDDGDDTPDDGDDTPDDGDDTPDDGDDTPDDGDDTPEETRPLDDPDTPVTPSGGLPQTGTDLTTVMFALGLITLGAGSIIALATRRREEEITTV